MPEEDMMSQTMQQKELREKRLKCKTLIRDLEQLENRIRARKQEGQMLSGNKIDFDKVIENYRNGADDAEQEEEEVGEFLGLIEADPSQADLMVICQKLNALLISLRYKQLEVRNAEQELMMLENKM